MQSVDMSPQTSNDNNNNTYGLHRRRPAKDNGFSNNDYSNHNHTPSKARSVAKKLDLFPKMERDYEVRTERGASITLIGYFVMFVLVCAEVWEWRGLNSQLVEGIVVDTRLVCCY
jgi:hypothetical protein